MTPTEAGVREDCANTREIGNQCCFDRDRREHWQGIGYYLKRPPTNLTVLNHELSDSLKCMMLDGAYE